MVSFTEETVGLQGDSMGSMESDSAQRLCGTALTEEHSVSWKTDLDETGLDGFGNSKLCRQNLTVVTATLLI